MDQIEKEKHERERRLTTWGAVGLLLFWIGSAVLSVIGWLVVLWVATHFILKHW